ncbi:hypothetical protein [Leclercia sp.]|uniref:hypothetical protein n=1 Tax=Leclercia sp. TaxID=1898428 RepID=UPI002FDE3AC8
MKPLHELVILNNFYYCFLMAIKFRNCHISFSSSFTQREFLETWLTNAQVHKLFDKLVYEEIQWLKQSLTDEIKSIREFEYNIELIYYRSLEMIKQKEEKMLTSMMLDLAKH